MTQQVVGEDRGDVRRSDLALADGEATIVDLTALAVRGQPAAIDSLLRQIRPMVVRYCRARLGHGSRHYEAAEDGAQEVCLAGVTALPRHHHLAPPFPPLSPPTPPHNLPTPPP